MYDPAGLMEHLHGEKVEVRMLTRTGRAFPDAARYTLRLFPCLTCDMPWTLADQGRPD